MVYLDAMAMNNTSPGTVRRHGAGRWLLRVSAGSDALTGKRLQPSRVVCGSRDEALRALVEFQHEVLLGHVSHDKMTLDQLFDMWIVAPTKGGRLRNENTKYHEAGRYRRYVQPALGRRDVTSLKPKDFSLLYDALLSRMRLSPRSVHHVHSTLRAVYNWAWRRELVNANPLLRADHPSVTLGPPRAPSREVVVSHLGAIWDENPDVALAVWLAATLGLRRSEIAALKWSHIDLIHDVVHVVEGVTKAPGMDYQITNTKTGLHGQADFPLHAWTKELLVKRRHCYRRQLVSVGAPVTADGYILSGDTTCSRPLHPDALSKALSRHCKNHPELESITLQALRKYAASDLAGHGADETTASALLRNSPETARRHYQAANNRLVRLHALGLADRLLGRVA